MGQILKSNDRLMINECRECGKIECEDGGHFIHTLDDFDMLTDEEKEACEWFCHKMKDKSLPELSSVAGDYTREELAHIFILEHLLESQWSDNPICESCYREKMKSRILC